MIICVDIVGASVIIEGIGTQLWVEEGKIILCKSIIIQGMSMDLWLLKYAYICIIYISMCMYKFVCVYIYMCVCMPTYISSSFCWKKQEAKASQEQCTYAILIFSFKIPLLTQRNLASLEKWFIRGLEQGRCKVSLKYLVTREGKERNAPK